MNKDLGDSLGAMCPSCGAEVIPGSDTCEECGMDLQHAENSEPSSVLHRTLSDPLRSLNPPMPITVPPSEPIRSIVNKMIERRHGAVCVVDQGRMVGIFTERDILMRVAGKGYDLAGTPISKVMTPDPLGLSTGATVAEALHQMSVNGLRHIPILEEDRLVGITTVRGLLAYIVGRTMN